MTSFLAQFRLDPSGAERTTVRNRAPVLYHSADGDVALAGAPQLKSQTERGHLLAAVLLGLYRDSGTGFLNELCGEFALAIRLPARQKTLIAVDRMGIGRLAWSVSAVVLTLGTSASEVAAVCENEGRAGIDPQAMFNFMLSHMVPAPDTIYRNVRKLLPATALEFHGARQRELQYWQPRFDRHDRFDLASAHQQALPILERAIARLMPDEHTGSFLSGGLDSSTVTGLLGRTTGEPAKAFSIGFGIDSFNELEYARIASDHFGCTHHTYEVTAGDIVDMIPDIAATFDEPFGNSSAVPTYACARLASSQGVNHLLAGDGGDELFGGNDRYVRHSIFEKYFVVPNFLRTHVLSPLSLRIDPETSPFLLRKFSSYVRQAQIALPDRFESWNLIYREGPKRIFSSEFLESVDTEQPLEMMRDVWESCPGVELLDKMLWYDWKYTLADNDLRKVKTMCELAGVRASFPMLDEEFVDLSITIPSQNKIRRGELRSFFKDVARDILPREILSKTKHGFGLPFGQWLKTHAPLKALVHETIHSLSARNIFNDDFLRSVIEEHKTGHAGYYGYAIWDLIMLEQWLMAHAQG
jgi:asparagine synthase (glutamine-hydrolysing)